MHRSSLKPLWGIVLGLVFAMFLTVQLAVAQQPNPESDAQSPPSQSQDQSGLTTTSDTSSLVTVRGLVRNTLTGEPLPRALVCVEGDAAVGVLTDGEGRFEIPGLPVGPQIFEVRKPGFYDGRSTARGADAEDAADSTHNVLIAAQMPELSFSLSPAGSIRGQIVLSSGDPAQGIGVELLKRTIVDGRAVWQSGPVAKTNSEGIYRFPGLVAGVYALFTEPVMESEAVTSLIEPGSSGEVVRSGYASVFYPDGRDLTAAAKIQISNGEQAQANFALTLEPFHAVTATAILPRNSSLPGEATANFTATVLDAAGHRLAYIAQYDPATHTIQTLLPDGSYSLLVSSQQQESKRLTDRGESSTAGGSGFVQFVVAGHGVANLRIPLSAPTTSQLRLTVIRSATRLDGAAGEQSASSKAMSESIEVMASQTSEWISDGLTASYAQQLHPGLNPVATLSPGSYWLHAFTTASGFCEQSFTAGGASLASEPLTVGLSGTVAPTELTLRDDCAALTVRLPQSLTAIASGEESYHTVYVVPAFDSTSSVEPLTLRLSSGGSATIEGLTPGSYRVFIFGTPLKLEYRNPAVLAALPNPGQSVTLSPGAASNLVLEVTEQR